MPSLNFAAFADVAPQVAHYGRLAEQALHRDPEVAVWRVRQVIESLVAWQEHLAGIAVDRESLHQRIETLRGRDDAFGEVDVTARRLALKGLTAIRKSANDVVHVGTFSRRAGGASDASLDAVRWLERVHAYAHRLLGQRARFRMPPRPEVSEEVTRLTGELLHVETLINIERDAALATQELDAIEPRVQALTPGKDCPESTHLELVLGCHAQRQRLANNAGRLEVITVPPELRRAAYTGGSGTARELVVEMQNRGALQLVKLGRLDDAEQRTLELLELVAGHEPTSIAAMAREAGAMQPTLISGRLAGKLLGTAGLVEQHQAHAVWDAGRARQCAGLFRDSGAWFSEAQGQHRARLYELSALVDAARFGGELLGDERDAMRAWVRDTDPARLLPEAEGAAVYAFTVQLSLKAARALGETPPWTAHLLQVLCAWAARDEGLPADGALPQVAGGALMATRPAERPARLVAALDAVADASTTLGWVAHRYRRALGLTEELAVPTARQTWYEALPEHVRSAEADPLAAVPGAWL